MPPKLRRCDTSLRDTFSCAMCKRPDSFCDMVGCDKCERWFHYVCAKVNSDIEDKEFICKFCVNLQSVTGTCSACEKSCDESEVMNCKTCDNILHTECLAVGSEICTECANKQHNESNDDSESVISSILPEVQLRLLEEEEALMQQKLNAEFNLKLMYMKKKHQVITEGSLGGSVRRKPILSKDKEESVKKWTQMQSETAEDVHRVHFNLSENKQPAPSTSKDLNYLKNINQDVNISEPINRIAAESTPSQITIRRRNIHERNRSCDAPMQPNSSNNSVFTEGLNVIQHPDVDEYQGRCGQITPEMIAARQAMSSKKGLLPFDGDTRKWPMFRANFMESTVCCGFSNAENLDRLQRSLQGKAFDLVKGLMTFADNAPTIMATLQRRFGRPELIIHSLINEVQDYPAIRIDKLDTLVEFSSLVQDLCATIHASGLTAHLSNPILIQKIIDKLPAHWKVDWAKYKRNIQFQRDSLTTLNAWLMDLSFAASDVSFDYTVPQREQLKKTNAKQVKGYVQATRSNDDAATSSSSATNVNKCLLCKKGGHALEKCDAFLSLNMKKRWTIVLRRKICRRCLELHPHKQCHLTNPCGTDGCNRMHHQILHSTRKNENSSTSEPQPNSSNSVHTNRKQEGSSHDVSDTTNNPSAHNAHKSVSNIQFRIIPVRLYGDDLYIETYAFLDEGSSLTLIEEQLANQLQLKGEPNALCLSWTGGVVREEENSHRVDLQISGISPNATQYALTNTRTVKNLALPPQTYNRKLSTFSHLKGLPVEDYIDAVPQILIGSDHYSLTVPLEVVEGKLHDPVATRTRLGWVVSGPVHTEISQSIASTNIHDCMKSEDENLHEMVKSFFSLESFGVLPNKMVLESKGDAEARMLLQTTTIFNGVRYEAALLWKQDNLTMPNNYSMALRRLICLERKMAKDDTIRQFLKNQIEEYTQKGYIRMLTSDELIPKGKRSWFLPIFVVRNLNKPGKLRLVWDAAAKFQDVSLNSMLLTGPQSNSSLVAILYRFRQGVVAISGDLQEMFHQILVNAEDQMSQLFLWRDGDSKRSPDIFAMQVLTFGSTSSPSTAEYCMTLNAKRCRDEAPAAYESIIHNHYVDDWLESFSDEESAIKTITQVSSVHKAGGFIMRNWATNSNVIAERLNLDQQLPALGREFCDGTQQKVLGMWWSPHNDNFSFKIRPDLMNDMISFDNRRPTKREVLRLTMSVFDPLGLVGYIVVHLKIFMQSLWRVQLDWDEKISADLLCAWQECIRLLKSIETVSIPRHYSLSRETPKNVQLHVFTDASERVYATVAYIRFRFSDTIRCVLLGSKTKVAPNKPISVPRMELLGAVLGARFMSMLIDVHTIKFNEQFLWTDSQTVLKWLNSDARQYKQFVALRIGELLDSTDAKQWNWVPSKLNIADLATKLKEETNNATIDSPWFQGPDFLHQKETHWPKYNSYGHSDLKSESDELIHCSHHDKYFDKGSVMVDPERFSCWSRMRNAQACVLWAANKWLNCKSMSFVKPMSDYLQQGETLLIRYVQWCTFKKDVMILRVKNRCDDRSSPLYKLSPFLDDEQVIKLRGRTEYSSYLTIDQRQPILLPTKHHLTRLIIRHYHANFAHQMNETVINEIRQKFYIPRLRAELKLVIKDCQRCKFRGARPICPEMSPLPQCRMAAFKRAFTHTGLDYFGPLEVVHGRRVEKRYGVLFTCLSVRAIHLELADDLTTSSCILMIRNFVSRRGVPEKFYSDNGTNLRGANTTLLKEIAKINDSAIQLHFQHIKWTTIPPASPHMGGSWERLIRSVKSIIIEILPMRRPTEQILRSALIEIEGIINSRPLTYIPVDPDAPEALTPNHFLLGSSSGIKPAGDFRDAPEQLRNDWKVAQIIADRFWRRWVLEYLPTLCRRTKWFENVPNLEVGDLVILVDENSPRNNWSKAIVHEVYPGHDGKVRSVTIRTAKGTLLKRPVSKLAKLDVATRETGKTYIIPEYAYGGGDVAANVHATFAPPM